VTGAVIEPSSAALLVGKIAARDLQQKARPQSGIDLQLNTFVFY